MPPSDNLSYLKEQHDKLSSIFDEETASMEPFSGDADRRHTFLNDVEKLLTDIEKQAPHVETERDYSWLNYLIGKWQLRCLQFFGYNVYVPVLTPPEQFRVNRLTDDEIKKFVWRKADEISVTRRFIKSKRMAERAFDDWAAEEEKRDWLQAELYFATDALYGRGNEWKELDPDFVGPGDLWRYFTTDTFVWLEKVWLRDVIQLRAYERWLKVKKGKITSDIKEMTEDYFEACAEFKNILLDDSTKKSVSDEARQVLIAFVRQRYLVPDVGELYESKEEVINLVKTKAHRIGELSDIIDAYTARRYANNYVRLFYNNVVGAVNGDENSKQKLIEAFEVSEQAGAMTSIINCFEATILRHYVRELGPFFREHKGNTAQNV